jgi:hypothetical protein
MRMFSLAAVVAVGFASSLAAQNPANLSPKDKTEVFIQHLIRVAKIDPAQYRALVLEHEIGTAITELAHDADHTDHADGAKDCCAAPEITLASDFIQSALKELHTEYAAALKLEDEGRHAEAAELARTLATKADPYLAAYASLLVAESRFAAADPKDAAELEKVIGLCEQIGQKDRLYLIQDHRACELIALAFSRLGKPLQEFVQYAILLTDYYDLPADVAARAKARLAALDEEGGKPLGTVASWMNRVEKLLAKEQTGKDPTQTQQVEVVSALNKLIELQEARERKTCPNCGSGQCRGQCKNGRPKGNRSQRPAQVSALSQSKGEVLLHGVSNADPGTIWGQLKERDAARALQGFRGKLPARYERLLEQYYKNLSKTE